MNELELDVPEPRGDNTNRANGNTRAGNVLKSNSKQLFRERHAKDPPACPQFILSPTLGLISGARF